MSVGSPRSLAAGSTRLRLVRRRIRSWRLGSMGCRRGLRALTLLRARSRICGGRSRRSRACGPATRRPTGSGGVERSCRWARRGAWPQGRRGCGSSGAGSVLEARVDGLAARLAGLDAVEGTIADLRRSLEEIDGRERGGADRISGLGEELNARVGGLAEELGRRVDELSARLAGLDAVEGTIADLRRSLEEIDGSERGGADRIGGLGEELNARVGGLGGVERRVGGLAEELGRRVDERCGAGRWPRRPRRGCCGGRRAGGLGAEESSTCCASGRQRVRLPWTLSLRRPTMPV